MRFVFLNALPLTALNIDTVAILKIFKVNHESLKKVVPLMSSKACFIRHPATVKLLNKLYGLDLKPSNELYSFKDGDIIHVVVLKKPVRGEEVEKLTENDIDIYQVKVIK